jgi:hypothetical protein
MAGFPLLVQTVFVRLTDYEVGVSQRWILASRPR